MKQVLLSMFVLAFVASAASAQIDPAAGQVGLYADTQGNDCNIVDGAAQLLPIQAVVTGSGVSGTAIQFSAPAPACFLGATYLSDTAIWPVTVNSSQVGVAIGYGTCQATPIHVLTINFFAAGLASVCCEYPVLPDPNIPSGEIEVVNCTNNLIFGAGLTSTLNGDGSCPCGGSPPVAEATWGSVKALYDAD